MPRGPTRKRPVDVFGGPIAAEGTKPQEKFRKTERLAHGRGGETPRTQNGFCEMDEKEFSPYGVHDQFER